MQLVPRLLPVPQAFDTPTLTPNPTPSREFIQCFLILAKGGGKKEKKKKVAAAKLGGLEELVPQPAS